MADLQYIQEDGQVKTWQLQVKNTSSSDCFGTELVFDIPTGISLTGPLIDGTTAIEVSKGAYNRSDEKWIIGDIKAGMSSGFTTFEFTVDDITKANEEDDSFIITATVSSRCTDDNDVDNSFELMLKVGEDCIDANIIISAPTTDNGSTSSSCSETFTITI